MRDGRQSASRPGPKPMTPWAKIFRAVQRSTGVRLSSEDIICLSNDDAIMARGRADYYEEQTR